MKYDKDEEYKYKQRQKEWIKKHNLKKGDKVKVLRRAENYEDGWGTYWSLNGSLSEQDKTIGKVYEIYAIMDNSIRLDVNGILLYYYPYFVLEPVIQTQKLKVQKPKYKPYTKTMTLKQIREFYQKGG
jgi:hypothetical protein